jgi:RNA polymerase sigma-70 factor (ECF subfamily)
MSGGVRGPGKTAPTDVVLVERAAGGDVGAYEVLVRRYELPIVRLCVNMLGDAQAAEDAAQEVFFAAWRSLGRFRYNATFSTWLYRIAVNRCLRDLRRQRGPTVPLPDDLPTSHGLPHSELEAAELNIAVKTAVSRLPPEQRVVLLLREVEDLSYDQISMVLGVSMSAVKSRLYRARVDLARALSNEGPREP